MQRSDKKASFIAIFNQKINKPSNIFIKWNTKFNQAKTINVFAGVAQW